MICNHGFRDQNCWAEWSRTETFLGPEWDKKIGWTILGQSERSIGVKPDGSSDCKSTVQGSKLGSLLGCAAENLLRILKQLLLRSCRRLSGLQFVY